MADEAPPDFRLPRFEVARYRIELQAIHRLVLRSDRVGIVLRGAFGLAFRRLVCHDRDADCRTCLVRAACPYADVFAPSPPPGSTRLRLQADLPRPFVLEPDPAAPDEIAPGESFAFDLTLVGSAARWLPYFVVAFRKLGEEGIGPGRGRYRLAAVDACAGERRAEVYRHGSATMSSVTLAERPGAEEPTGRCERLRIRFETPTLLRAEGSVATVPEFGVLVKRLRDRVSALHYFYCGAAWEADHRGLGRLAEEVRAAEVRTGWVSRVRRSSRTGQRHPLEGFVGEAVYEGRDLRPFLPLLRVGERVHVGKAATFGQGRFRVLDDDPS